MNNTTMILAELLERFPVPKTSTDERAWDSLQWNAWEAVGLYYVTEGRYYEGLSIFATCYERLLEAQELGCFRIHKGKPLIWMSDCYWHMNWLVHSKRYLMLAFCEDLLSDSCKIIEHRGAYYRGLWRHGITKTLFIHISHEAAESKQLSSLTTLYPEALLQDLTEDWLTETPDSREVGSFTISHQYAQYLIGQTGEKSGRALERLAHYLVSCMPGVRTRKRLISGTSEYDIVCSMDGFEQDFRSELGRYFICECKDWSSKVGFESIAKFTSLLNTTNARFGILFSLKGISGAGTDRYATRELRRVYAQHKTVIVVLSEKDLKRIAAGANLIEMLRKKYEAVRLDLPLEH